MRRLARGGMMPLTGDRRAARRRERLAALGPGGTRQRREAHENTVPRAVASLPVNTNCAGPVIGP